MSAAGALWLASVQAIRGKEYGSDKYMLRLGDLATEGLHIPAVTMANRLLKLFETLIHVQDEMKYNQKR